MLFALLSVALMAPPESKPMYAKNPDLREPLKYVREEFTDGKAVCVQPNWTMGNKRVAQLRFPWGMPDKNLSRAVFLLMGKQDAEGEFFKLDFVGDRRIADRKLCQYEVSADGVAHFVCADALTYTAKPTGEPGTFEIAWKASKPLAVNLRTNTPYRKSAIRANGEPLVFAGEEALAGAADGKLVRPLKDVSKIEINAAATGFVVTGLPAGEGTYAETLTRKRNHPDKYSISIKTAPATEGRIVIDLGVSPSLGHIRRKFPSVNGLDISHRNGIDVAPSPVRNLIRNPSFERGFDYWTLKTGQNHPDEDVIRIVEGGKFGQRCLWMNTHLKNKMPHNVRESFLVTLPTQLKDGETYTVSAWAKSAGGEPVLRAKGDPEPRMLYLGVGSNNTNSPRPAPSSRGNFESKDSRFPVTDDWRRFSYSFKAGPGGFKCFLAPLGGAVLVDGVQVEPGETATDFVAPPAEPTILPDGTLRVTGAPNARAKMKISVENIFREKVWQESHGVAFDEQGIWTGAFGEGFADHCGKGIFEVRFDFTAEGKTFHAYARHSAMEALPDTRRPTAWIAGVNVTRPTGVTRPREYVRKLREWGFGSISWGTPDLVDAPSVPARLVLDEGISNVLSVAGQQLFYKPGIWDKAVFADRADVLEKPEAPWNWQRKFCRLPLNAEQEKAVEETMYRYMKRVDPRSMFSCSWFNEEEGGEGLVADGRYDEYAKYQLAARRGVKRAHPTMKYAYSCGPTSLRDNKIGIIESYLVEAEKQGVKYDVLPFHAYGLFDALDEQLEKAEAMFRRHGYGPGQPMLLTEFSNERQLDVREWNTLNGDVYTGYLPGYSIGHWEVLNAAWAMRVWIIALKHYPWLRHTNCWAYRIYADADLKPLVLCKAANTFAHLLPDVKYVGMARPADSVRAYAFTRPGRKAIAAIWQTNRNVDLSQAPCPQVSVRFSQPVGFIDMMENPRSSKAKGGVTTFAATYTPLFIEADNADALLKDLQSATVKEFDTEKVADVGVSAAGGAGVIEFENDDK